MTVIFALLHIAVGSRHLMAACVALGRQWNSMGISIWISREVLSFCYINTC